IRNATLTTIAPTGTISEIAGCSNGIEPLFAIVYTKAVRETLGENLTIVNPLFENVAIEEGFYSEELMKKIASSTSIQHIEEIPEHVRRIFVTAHDISPEWHVRMQAAFQKYVDNAVSKTINFPHDASMNDIEQAYLLAYRLGCKGLTVYRDRSRSVQVLTTKKGEEGEQTELLNMGAKPIEYYVHCESCEL
ncbi:MAG: ribonucleoside-diphosphate reductase, adenosylcobalamin-dependent, partial [Nitrososphaerales archaeon]